MLKSILCDYSDPYILIKGTMPGAKTVTAANANNNDKKVIFKNCTQVTDCMSEINSTQVGNAKGIDIVMPMYNFIEYTNSYSKTSKSLW